MTIENFLAIRWGDVEGPLIEPPRFSPIVADPSFLFPEETPEGKWELFAHSAWGIHRYSSDDGLSWSDRGIVVRNAMRPFIRRIDTAKMTATTNGTALSGKRQVSDASFFLYFESYPPLALPLTALPLKQKWHSTIALTRSNNLRHWSRAETIARPEFPWMRDAVLGASVSNPCLVKEPGHAGGWRLYYSASLVYLPDCGFCEPRYIACATGPTPESPFTANPAPLIDPAEDAGRGRPSALNVPGTLNAPGALDSSGILGAGSMKVIALDDGYAGLQNKIYRDPAGRSRSAIFLLRSEDGLSWRPARDEPLLAPAPSGWTSSHVYACDCRFREADGCWYLYFNARDGWRISEGKERIGRIVGRA